MSLEGSSNCFSDAFPFIYLGCLPHFIGRKGCLGNYDRTSVRVSVKQFGIGLLVDVLRTLKYYTGEIDFWQVEKNFENDVALFILRFQSVLLTIKNINSSPFRTRKLIFCSKIPLEFFLATR